MGEIEDFVEDKRKFIKENFDQEISNEIDINSIDDAYKVMLQLTNKNLDIVELYKKEHDKSNDDQEKAQLKELIVKLMNCVSDTLSAYNQRK